MARHVCEIELRWADLDLLGHVNNVKYFEIMQEARVKFHADISAPGDRGAGQVVLLQTEIRYLSPATLASGPLSVETTVTHIGRTSYRMSHRIQHADGSPCASGSVVLVAWDLVSGTKREISDTERLSMLPYLVQAQEPQAT